MVMHSWFGANARLGMGQPHTVHLRNSQERLRQGPSFIGLHKSHGWVSSLDGRSTYFFSPELSKACARGELE